MLRARNDSFLRLELDAAASAQDLHSEMQPFGSLINAVDSE